MHYCFRIYGVLRISAFEVSPESRKRNNIGDRSCELVINCKCPPFEIASQIQQVQIASICFSK